MIYQNQTMRNTADVTGDLSTSDYSISLCGAVSPLGAFYDIHERKGEVLFYSSVSDTTRLTYEF
jgi:hypothetical protein